MADQGLDFAQFAWSFVDGKPLVNRTGIVPANTELSTTISTKLRARGFSFVGPTIVYAWMQAVGLVDDHSPECFKARARSEHMYARPNDVLVTKN